MYNQKPRNNKNWDNLFEPNANSIYDRTNHKNINERLAESPFITNNTNNNNNIPPSRHQYSHKHNVSNIPLPSSSHSYINTTSQQDDSLSTYMNSPSRNNELNYLNNNNNINKKSISGDICELDYLIGTTVSSKNTLIAHPSNPSKYIKAVGSFISINDLNNSQEQIFLKGHENNITSLSLSVSGAFLASGQIGTLQKRCEDADIILWDLNTYQELCRFTNLTNAVKYIYFSPDENFLCGCGEDGLLFIWEIRTGETIFARRFNSPIEVFQWGHIFDHGHRSTYEIILCVENQVTSNLLKFNPTRVQWEMETRHFQLHQSSMAAGYTCSCISPSGDETLLATKSGEVIVLHLSSLRFLNSTICNVRLGVTAIISKCIENDQAVFIGGGDGTLLKVQGSNSDWNIIQSINLNDEIISLTMTIDGNSLLVSTINGNIYQINCNNLNNYNIISSSHTSSIISISFPDEQNNKFATLSSDGIIKIWNLDNYSIITEKKEDIRAGSGKCLCWDLNEDIIIGWEDGFVRCYTAISLRKNWEIPNAHRTSITSIASHRNGGAYFLLTGSEDGFVRIWSLVTREMINQYQEHQGIVTKVLPDLTKPHIIHSCSIDGTMLAFNLKTDRRIMFHVKRGSSFHYMTQKKTDEEEIITCDHRGNLICWDIDYADPILEKNMNLNNDSDHILTSCAVSPSGKYIATSSNDSTIKIYDIENDYSLIGFGAGHSTKVNMVVWTPDQKQLLSIGEDSCIAIWNFFG